MTAVNTGTEVTDALATEALAFRRKLPQLLVRHEGEFIALYRGRVVVHGANAPTHRLRSALLGR